jgi:hypothetical protein
MSVPHAVFGQQSVLRSYAAELGGGMPENALLDLPRLSDARLRGRARPQSLLPRSHNSGVVAAVTTIFGDYKGTIEGRRAVSCRPGKTEQYGLGIDFKGSGTAFKNKE